MYIRLINQTIMKKSPILLFIVVLLNLNFGFSQTTNDPLNILFVGNSITYFNNLPQTFKQIADEQGNHVTIDQHTPGGTGFVHHEANSTLYDKFRNTVWDYVILQPGSSESIGASYPIATTTIRAQRLKDSITKYSPCASIHYYEISYGIVNDTPASFQQYLDRQLIIKNNLTQMSNATNIPFIPAGECFKNSMQTDPSQFLWVNYYDIHPNPKGSFLAACSFYNAIFKQPIVNSAITGGVSVADANYLRNQAETTTLNNLDDWLINNYTATANFTYTATSTTTVDFTSTATNQDNILWNFGDGTTSTQPNTTHTFDFNVQNSYTVVLTAYKNCKEHHKLITITQSELSTADFEINTAFNIYPNPTLGTIYIDKNNGETIKSVKIYDVIGKQISANLYTISSTFEQIDIRNLSAGIYLLQIDLGTHQINKKIVKK